MTILIYRFGLFITVMLNLFQDLIVIASILSLEKDTKKSQILIGDHFTSFVMTISKSYLVLCLDTKNQRSRLHKIY